MHSLDACEVNDFEIEDQGELDRVNQCRLILLEAGADPDIVPTSFSNDMRSFIEYTMWNGTSVSKMFSPVERLSLIETKESLQLLFDHGGPLFVTSDMVGSGSLLKKHLFEGHFTLKTVALLLRRSGTQEIPVQNLVGCLYLAIRETHLAEPDELKGILNALLQAGADPYERAEYETVSEVTCDPHVMLCDSRMARRHNHDLVLRDIWSQALTACGYDAEEVISNSLRLRELSDASDGDISDVEDDISADESYRFMNELDDASDPDDEASKTSNRHEEDQYSPQTHTVWETSHYERSVLEGGAEVWQS